MSWPHMAHMLHTAKPNQPTIKNKANGLRRRKRKMLQRVMVNKMENSSVGLQNVSGNRHFVGP